MTKASNYEMHDKNLNMQNTSDLSLDSLKLNDNEILTSESNIIKQKYSPSSKSHNRSRSKPENNKKNKQKLVKIDYSAINSESFNIEKELDVTKDKFFVIKSFSAQDVYNSIIYKIWCSTESGNIKLNSAFKEPNGGNVYLFFSVNGSGYFCGVAKMVSEVDFNWQPDAHLWSHSTKVVFLFFLDSKLKSFYILVER
jgi:hypothetical protein